MERTSHDIGTSVETGEVKEAQPLDFAHIIEMCAYLGQHLQGIKKEECERTIPRLLNEAARLEKNGFTSAAIMFLTVAKSMEDYSQPSLRPYVKRRH